MGKGREGLLQPLSEQRATPHTPNHALPLPPAAHEAGLVPLQVAQDSCLLSPSVLFEYRARNFLALPSTQLDWLSLDGEWGMRPPPSHGQGTLWAFRCRAPTPHTGGSPPLTTVPFNDRSKSQ